MTNDTPRADASKIREAICSYYKDKTLLNALAEHGCLRRLTQEEALQCLIDAGMSKEVALFNKCELWDFLVDNSIAITPSMADKALQIFAREGAICSLRLILPYVADVDAPLVKGYTPLAYTLNGCLPTSCCYDGFWRIRMYLECAKSLLDAGADIRKVTFMPEKMGLPETEMVSVLHRALKFMDEARELRRYAGTPNDEEVYALILLLRGAYHPEAEPKEKQIAEAMLARINNWRKDLAPLAPQMRQLKRLLTLAEQTGNYPQTKAELKALLMHI